MENCLKRIKSQADIDEALVHLCATDDALASVYEKVKAASQPVPHRLREGGFPGLAQIVISQLVSKASANAIHQRFVLHISPQTPENYLECGEDIWRKIGLSRPKQNALYAIAEALLNGELNLQLIGELNVEDAIKHLTAIKGIGPWSAHIYLLFCEGHPDIFPSGDLALREAARLIWQLEERPSDKELERLSHQWSPRRGVAARLLWSYYAVCKNRTDTTP